MIKLAGTISSAFSTHSGFLDYCLQKCYLTTPKLVEIMFEIDVTAQSFASSLAQKTRDMAACMASFRAFTKYVKKFIQAIQHYATKNSDHTLGTPTQFPHSLGSLFSYINLDYIMAVEL